MPSGPTSDKRLPSLGAREKSIRKRRGASRVRLMVDDTANSLPSRWTKSFPCPCLGGVAAGGAWSSIGPSRNISRKSCARPSRSEEHTSELQSRLHLVCRLLLEKKKHIQ